MTETIDTAQPEALRLADELDEEAGRITQYTNRPGDLLRELAATELRRLHSALAAAEARNATLTDDAARWRAILAHVQALGPDDFEEPITDATAWVKTIDDLVAAMKEKTP